MATALDHPSHCTITHCSIATSDNQAYVFILDNTSITNYILNYLITTKQKQIWHNASYDFRFLQYFTGNLPYDYEDTQILAKCLINHVNTFKAKTGLKELAGHMYGSWAISKDNFSIEHMYEEHVLKYAAIDSCATYWVYNYMMTECDAIDSKIIESTNIDWEAPY
jgi:ribonuclease D